MNQPPSQVTIHLARIAKPTRSYHEGFVDDNGIRLKTFTQVTQPDGAALVQHFSQAGWILPSQQIHSVSKVLFYHEFFDIVAYQGPDHKALGYYCDIVTPLRRRGRDYFLTDLILDVWITPDLQAIELDRDEYEAALTTGIFPLEFQKDALAALQRLKTETAAGIFPARYLS